MNTLQGLSFLGYERGCPSGHTFHALDATTGAKLEPAYHECSTSEADRACAAALDAFAIYRRTTGAERARFLRAIADEIMALGPELLDRYRAESGLPQGRAEGERGRTCAQLRLFADLVEEGSWVRATLDLADPARAPLPKPDTRLMHVPLGPVAVFGPANFPLAFTVAGGDTASALAAGCPVVVKAHSSHPGVSELVGLAVRRAVERCGLPAGVFSLLFGSGRVLGPVLARHRGIRAIGFTGSRAAGRELFDLACARPDPIPVFAEMSSINPLLVLPGALAERGAAIAEGLAGSVTQGCGQFCTKPGLVFLEDGPAAQDFAAALAAKLRALPAAPMLNARTRRDYREGVARHAGLAGVHTLVAPPADGHAAPGLFQTDADTFLSTPALHEEIFGPCTLLILCRDRAAMLRVLDHLEGQLTATVHAGAGDDTEGLRDLLTQKAGRVLWGGYPTGVEVNHSIVHSGPYPATTDARFTSVGAEAIYRFSRPVCYQNAPAAALPAELRDENPLGLLRRVNGAFTRDPVAR